jgi:methane/ammonia monooxygenase subunit C
MMAASREQGYDISQWYDSKPVKLGWLGMLSIGVFWVLYQRTFGYSHGLDSMTPEFDSVWMGLWRFNILANAVFFAVSIGWIWVTRDRNLTNLDPKLELKRYFYWMGWLVCYIWGVYYAGSYTLEQDAAWHQVIIRDTSFTASHIVAFYGTFPLYITCGVSSYLYAQTRLPLYSQATSFPLVAAVVGPMFILPNVGLNEWGHAFWFVDELFAAPLHWGFVTLGWCGLFGAAGGVAAQIVSRMSNLADVIWNNAPKAILDPFPSQVGPGAKSVY